MTERVAVLGGGAAGVVAASYVSRDPRFTVDLLESGDHLGGLHRGTIIDGIALDIGAFLFSSAHELLATFPAVRDRFVRVSPHYVRVTPQGSFDRYPLSLAGFRRDNGLAMTCLALADLMVSKVRDRARASVREFASYYMGRSIYEKSGLPQYLRRLYGMDDTEIALDFALQRLTSLRDYTFSNAVKRVLQRFNAFARQLPPFKLLARPLGGFEQVYEEIAHELRERGVNIETSIRITCIERDDGFVVHSDRGARRYDHVISTIPMPTTLSLLGIEPQGTYDAMDLYSLYFRGRVIPDGDVYYNFTNDGLWKRMTVFTHLYKMPLDTDYFTVEVTSRAANVSIEELVRDFERHARALGLITESTFVDFTLTRRAYPVFRLGETEGIEADRQTLRALGIDLAGRQGRFEFLTSHVAAEQARKVAQAL